jgi:hypothetical protein
MAIGRTEDRNTPGNPLGRKPRRDVLGSDPRNPSGPAVNTAAHQGRTHDRNDQTRLSCKKVLARRGPSTQGFRMPAGRDLSAGGGPASESLRGRNPRGPGGRSAVYGDLIGQLRRGMNGAGSLRGDCGRSLRIGRRRCIRRCDSATIGGIASAFAGTRATVGRRRKRHAPAGG